MSLASIGTDGELSAWTAAARKAAEPGANQRAALSASPGFGSVKVFHELTVPERSH
jgi:hypothetical protein